MKPPTAATLRKYGLSAGDWLDILERQEGKCAVCRKPPKRFLHIDHEHVRGWKTLPPEKRKQFVRGLLCWFCNANYVGRSITIAKSERVTAYLKAHLERMVLAGLGLG